MTMNRRQLLYTLASIGLGSACSTEDSTHHAELPRLSRQNVCFLTDEVSGDLDAALAFAKEFGISQVEIRGVYGRYCFLHDRATLDKIHAKLRENGVRVAMLSTPLMKCIAPGYELLPAVHEEIRQSEETFPVPHDEQFRRCEEFLHQAIEAAKILETGKIRVFSFWRIADPPKISALILDKLSDLAAIADKAGMKLCMENESACNVADCGELAAVMSQAPPNVGMIWDVVNGTSTGETPFPDGYEKLDPTRIHHIHLKDVKIDAVTGERRTVAVGDGMIPYPRVFAKLAADGYGGALSMETHFSLDGSKEAASRRSMQGILKALEAQT